MQIGTITIEQTAALAPMAGVCDRAFREICVEMGAAYVVGEMTSSKGLCYNSAKSRELLYLSEAERPAAAQIFGDDPEAMVRAAEIAMQYAPDAIDINMGCPAPKITGNGCGSALMKNPPLAGEIIKAVSAAVPVPVTVKIRKGWDDYSANAVEMAILAQQNGAAAITVHGRTRAQMYAPPVDLACIKAVKEAVSIPVIGNGGIDSAEKALQMYAKTGCDLVMVGQGALGAPWVFREIKALLQRGECIHAPDPDEKMQIMLRHIALACRYKGEGQAMREARSHAAWYLRGLRGAAALRRQAGQLRGYEDLEMLARAALDATVHRV